MAQSTDLRNGTCFYYNDDVCIVTDYKHSHTGRGSATIRVKIKSLTTGKTNEITFGSNDRIDLVPTEKRPHQYTYKDEYGLHFMNVNTFEDLALPDDMVPSVDLLKEGQDVDILFDANTDKPINCEMPAHVVLKITYTEPGIKGDTVSNTFKPATVETGATIQVPLFINQDEVVKVDTRDYKYVERVK